MESEEERAEPHEETLPPERSWRGKCARGILSACLLLLFCFGVLEGLLFLLGVRPAWEESDPTAGYGRGIPLFVERKQGGETTLVTAPNKLPFFNKQEFPKRKPPKTRRVSRTPL